MWKFDTPQPERGGPTTTASGVGFVGGGDGNLRAFDVKTGNVLWTFQTGFQIAAGPSIYSVNGTEYVAIAVGGTPTSSSGGTVASQIQVFDLGGTTNQSTPPTIAGVRKVAASQTRSAAGSARAVHVAAANGSGSSSAHVTTPAGLFVQTWNANTSNTSMVTGHVMLGGQPVAGAVVTIGGWAAAPTDKTGAFQYPVDISTPFRHVATVTDVSHATVNGKALTSAQRDEVSGRNSGISVGYQVTGVQSHVQANGNVVVTGKLSYGDTAKTAPPTVLLYSYELKGRITDANGNPVSGAIVTTRTNDRQYWTQ